MAAKKTDKEEAGSKVNNESRDHIYYTITPRLVWALARDPYEYTLWGVVKDIAGEGGECILAREDLAELAMMSSGKVSQARDSLIAKKLLKGELKRDPGYPQEVWHLSIPDFWEANVRWARMYPTIRSRVAFKREQKGIKDPSPRDGLGLPSPHDEGIPPHDEGIPPHDTKNNVFKKQIEEINLEELKSLFSDVSEIVLDGPRNRSALETIKEDISQARIYLSDGIFFFDGIDADRAAYYQDRYKSSFERSLVGYLGAEVPVSFISNGAHV